MSPDLTEIELTNKTSLSVIIITRGGGAPRALNSVIKNATKEVREIIVVEGDNPSLQRNKGAEVATGNFLCFLDDDCELSNDFFIKAVEVIDRYNPDVFGGCSIYTYDNNSAIRECISDFFASRFGTFFSASRWSRGEVNINASEDNIIGSNLFIRKDCFYNSGGFNETLYPNEENELVNRLKIKGYKINYFSELELYKPSPATIKEFIVKLFRYGDSRVRHFLILPLISSVKYFLALLFTIYLIFLPILILWKGIVFITPLLLYFSSGLFASLFEYVKKRIGFRALCIMPFIFFIGHLSYGMGQFFGFFNYFKKSEKSFIGVKNIERIIPGAS